MDNIIKDQKQMIQYLHKQAEDHVKTRNMLIEMNEELEKEMNQKDDDINKLKKELKAKDKRLNAFKEDTLNKSVDVDRLLEEIKLLERQNRNKEYTLANIVKENKGLQENLVILEKEKETLKCKIAINDKKLEQNLGDELGILDPRQHNVSPECENKSVKKVDIKKHDENMLCDSLTKKIWKLKELQLEKDMNFQKLKLASDIIYLKEKEVGEIQVCTCRSFCRIFHKKHNWKKPISQVIVEKFRDLDKAYSCKTCDETFKNVDCLKLHVNTIHAQVSSRED